MPNCRSKKVISLFIAFLFLASNLGLASLASGIALYPSEIEAEQGPEIQIPPELGTIKHAFRPETAYKFPFIIHIQTVHTNYETALKVEKIIHHLKDQYGIHLLFVEGGSGSLHPELLNFFPDHKLNRKFLDTLAQNGQVTGADLALLDSEIRAVGIESANFYRAAFQDFEKVIRGLKDSEAFIRNQQEQLDRKASKVFSPDFRKLLEIWQKYRTHRRNLTAVVKFFREESKKVCAIDFEDPFSQFEWPQLTRLTIFQELEKRIDLSQFQKEKEKLKAQLKEKKISSEFIDALDSRDLKTRADYENFLRNTYPLEFRFKDYPQITYQSAIKVLQSELDARTLFAEFDKLFEKLFQARAKKKEEVELLRQYQTLILLQKLIRLELTREEWEKVKHFKLNDEFKIPSLTIALRFYRLCERREKAFYENLKREMNARHQTLAILVTGGFHEEGMRRLFKKKGMGYASISPHISEAIDGSLYRRVMLGQAQLDKPEILQKAGEGTLTDSKWLGSELSVVGASYERFAGKSLGENPPVYFQDRLAYLSGKQGKLLTPAFAVHDVDLTDFASDQDAEIRMRELADQALRYRTASISTYQKHFKYLPIRELRTAGIHVGGVVAFPGGLTQENLEDALREVRRIIESGGNEIDLVMDYRSILEGDPKLSKASLEKFREGVEIIEKEFKTKIIVKTIIETQALRTEEKIREAANIALPYSDMIKMVTGFPVEDLGISQNQGSLQAAKVMLGEIKKYYETTGELKGLKITGGIWYWDNPEAPDRSVLPYYQLVIEILGESLADHFLGKRDLFRIGGKKLLDDLKIQIDRENRVKEIQKTIESHPDKDVEALVKETAQVLSQQTANVVFEWNKKEKQWLFRRSGIKLAIDPFLTGVLGKLVPNQEASLLFPLRDASRESIYQALVLGIRKGVLLKEAFEQKGLKALSDYKKVLLIAPYGDEEGYPLRYVTPHKGVEYISFVLLRSLNDVDARVYNPNLTSPESLYEFVSRERFDVIGFSLLQSVIEKNTEILARVRQIQPEAMLMLGGHELPRIVQGLKSQRLSSQPLPVLGTGRHPFLDFIEAMPIDLYIIDPASVIEVIRNVRPAATRDGNLDALRNVSDVIVIKGDEIVRTSNGKHFFPTFSNVDQDVPDTENDLTHGTHYMKLVASVRVPVALDRIGNNPFRVVLSDFCAAKCIFCGVNEFKRPPPPVEEVMKILRGNFRDHDSIHFEHVDFLFNVDYARKLALALRDSEFRTIPKIVVARVNNINDEIAKLFYDAGIRIIAFGVESFDAPVLRNIGKSATVEENERALETTLRNGIRPGLNLIFFTPWDTFDSLKRTADKALSYALRGAYLNIVPIMNAGYGRPIASMSEVLDYKMLNYPGMKKPLAFPGSGKILDEELRAARKRVAQIKEELLSNLVVSEQHKTVGVESLLWIKAFYLVYQERRPHEDVSSQIRDVDQAIVKLIDTQMKSVEGSVVPFKPENDPYLAIPSREESSSLQAEAYMQTKFPSSLWNALKKKEGSVEIHQGPFSYTQTFLENMAWRGYKIIELKPEKSLPHRFYSLTKGEDTIYIIANVIGPSRQLFMLQVLTHLGYPPERIRIRNFQYNPRAIYEEYFGSFKGKIEKVIMTHEVDRYVEVLKSHFPGLVSRAERIVSDMVLGYVIELESGKRLALFDMQFANGQHIEEVIRFFADDPEKGGMGVNDITVHGAAGVTYEKANINDLLLYTEVVHYEEHQVTPSVKNDFDRRQLEAFLQGTEIEVHSLPFYTIPTVLNASLETTEMIENAGGGAIDLELSHAILVARDYPGIKFRAVYEAHDKPADRIRGKEQSLGATIPGYTNRAKREAGWRAIQRYILGASLGGSLPVKSFGTMEGSERLKQFRAKTGKPVKVTFVALSAPEFPTFSETYGISSIAGDLKHHFPNHVEIKILDMNANPGLDAKAVVEALRQDLPDVVAISAPFYSFTSLQKVVDGLRQRIPEDAMPLLVVGKSMPNYQFERLLNEHYPEMITVQGEGEVAMRDLIRYRQGEIAEEAIKNIAYRKEGKIVVNRRESLDLATVGLPYRDHLSDLVREGGQVFVETSRGCYWSNCVFCAIRGLLGSNDKDKRWRTFPTEHVLDALEELDRRAKNENPNYANISFADEEFLGHSEDGLRRAIELAKGIKKRGLNIKFRISTTAKSVWDKDDNPVMRELRKAALRELKEAGLEKVFLGLESGSDSQLKKLNKGITAEENRNAVLLLKDEIGVEVDVGFIMFNPLSTFEELKENIQFVETTDIWKSVSSLFNEARIYVGTPLSRLLQFRHPELISQNYDMETGNYGVKFSDLKVDAIYKAVKEWEKSDHLVEYHLKTMTRNKTLAGLASNFLFDSLVRWRRMDLDLLKGLVEIFDREPVETTASGALLRKYQTVRLGYVRDLIQFLEGNAGIPRDQKGALEKSLKTILSDETHVPSRSGHERGSDRLFAKFKQVVQKANFPNLILLTETQNEQELYRMLSSSGKITERYQTYYLDAREELEKKSLPEFSQQIEAIFKAEVKGNRRPLIFIANIHVLLRRVHDLPLLKNLLLSREHVIVGNIPVEEYANTEANILKYDETGNVSLENAKFLSDLNFELWPTEKDQFKTKKIVVFGATGLIGSRIIKELRRRGYDHVTGVSRQDHSAVGIQGADLANPDMFRKITEGADIVINAAVNLDFQAMQNGGDEGRKVRDVNVGIVENLKKSGYKGRVIHLSSYYVFEYELPWAGIKSPRKPASIYGQQKLEAEDEASQIENSAVVRVGPIIGFDDTGRQKSFYRRIIEALDKSRKGQRYDPVVVHSTKSSALMSPHQVANAVIDLLELNDKGIIQLSGKTPLSEKEQVERITKRYNEIYGTQIQLQTIEKEDASRKQFTPKTQMLSVVSPDLDEAITSLIQETPENGAERVFPVTIQSGQGVKGAEAGSLGSSIDLKIRIPGTELAFMSNHIFPIANRFQNQGLNPYELLGAVGMGGIFEVHRDQIRRNIYRHFLREVIAGIVFEGRDEGKTLMMMDALQDLSKDNGGVDLRREMNHPPVILQIDARALDPNDKESIATRLALLPSGSVIIEYADFDKMESSDILSSMMSRFPKLHYFRKTFRTTLQFDPAHKELMKRAREYDINPENAGFLISDLKFAESEGGREKLESLGVIFQFDPSNLPVQMRMLKGLSGAVLEELVEYARLDRAVRERLLAEAQFHGLFGFAGGAYTINLDLWLESRRSRFIYSAA